MSDLVSDLPETTVTPEIRVDCSDTVKFQVVDRVRGAVGCLLQRGRPIGTTNLGCRT
ncbi:MAG: hypothetical protein U0361_21410 [Nitrospiraceae bacterium]